MLTDEDIEQKVMGVEQVVSNPDAVRTYKNVLLSEPPVKL